jgi:hypothetical protein
MNVNKFILLLLLIFTFSSCENEPVDPLASEGTTSTCTAPFSFSVSAIINENSVRIDWDKSALSSAWEIQYGTNGFQIGTGTTVNFTRTSSLIGGLTATVDYDFYIRTNCGKGLYSDWVGPVSIGSGISNCANPTSLSAVRSGSDPSTATITWSAVGDVNTWQVQYGASGFVLGSGTTLASAMPTKTISDLVDAVSYDVYVRSNCDANQNSNWVGPILIPAAGVPNDTAFFALVDGVEFVDVGPINVNTNSLLYGLPSIYLIATDANNNVIEINISNDAVVGTQYFNNNDATDKYRIVYFEPLPTELEVDTDGSLTVTERTATRIKGTFYFSALDEFNQIVKVTNGTFDVEIP